MRNEIKFNSGGTRCAGWHFRGEGQILSGSAGRPCLVMAAGFSATRDSGLQGFAERFAAAGADVLLFDYRNFGASEGQPRQLLDVAAQRADYRAAIECARGLDGVDQSRIVLWGVSLSGGHVLQVAAEDPRIAAVIALTPAADARASMGLAIRANGLRTMALVMAAGLRDAVGAARGRAPVTIPVVGPPGSTAVFTSEHARNGYATTAGETWRNEVAARIALQIGLYRPIRHAKRLTCPTLVQIADEDTMASPKAAGAAAWRARADVRHYPCDHIDVLPGHPWFEPTAEHQLHFLRRHLATRVNAEQEPVAA